MLTSFVALSALVVGERALGSPLGSFSVFRRRRHCTLTVVMSQREENGPRKPVPWYLRYLKISYG